MTKKKITAPEGEQWTIKKGEPLKNMISEEALRKDALIIQSVYSDFPVDEFTDSVIDESWGDLELKARWQKMTSYLGKYLPPDFGKSLGIIDEIVKKCPLEVSVLGTCFPSFVESYGLDEKNLDLSISALERYTVYWSSEFAVRAFIIKYEDRMMKQMYNWSEHENEHVRRLASEGCRPLLPWAQVLTGLKADPTPILPILEQLKSDSSQYVRKSVANNINDISKNHPDLITKLAESWYGKNEHTDWIVKHGCRTLLKKSNRDVLAIFGYHDTSIDVKDFTLDKTSIAVGEKITFSFSITTKAATKVRLEYGIDYIKANGKPKRKVFQISETSLGENITKDYQKSHSFEDVSTRKHYPGKHSITLILNGVEQEQLDFELR